jgi:hypothetical protein
MRSLAVTPTWCQSGSIDDPHRHHHYTVMPRTPKRKQPAIARKSDETVSFSLRLPVTLASDLDTIAAGESRSRAKMIEVALREFVQSYQRRTAS